MGKFPVVGPSSARMLVKADVLSFSHLGHSKDSPAHHNHEYGVLPFLATSRSPARETLAIFRGLVIRLSSHDEWVGKDAHLGGRAPGRS
jgi:hypothetical protein